MSNHDEIKELVKRISGRDSVISIQRVYLDIFGDLSDAAVLSQCVFWSDKGRNERGWFYKSISEWHTEIGIKRASLETAIAHLKEKGVVETKVLPARNNSPTMHYRVDMDKLTALVVSYLSEQLSSTSVRHAENSISENKPTNGRSAENSTSDLLKSANRLAENSISSYSSLQQSLTAVADIGLADPVWVRAVGHLRQSMNGTYEPASPRLVAADENPYKFTVLVNQTAPGLKPTIKAAVDQAVRELKLRRKIAIDIVTEWPGYTPVRRVAELKPDTPPAVAVYIDVTGVEPNDIQRKMMVEQVGDRIDEWRAVLVDWLAHNWKPNSVPEQLERLTKRGNHGHTQTTPATRTSAPQQPTDAQLAAAERINAARAAKQAQR